ETVGLPQLVEQAQSALSGGDAQGAAATLRDAVKIDPGNAALWLRLARALNAVKPDNDAETVHREANSAAIGAYRLTRSAAERADSLAALAATLDRRDLYRPALSAYEASLALV